MSYIFGRKPVIEALRHGTNISKIYFQFGIHGNEIAQIKTLAKQKSILIAEIDKIKISQIVSGENSQGVVAQISEKSFSTIDEILSSAKNENPFVLIFDEIMDPHNLGALIRSGVSFGAHGGILPKHNSAQISPATVKSSAGATELFKIANVTNIANEIEYLKKKNLWIVGTDKNSANKNYFEIDYTIPIALVIGNEEKGIRKLVKEKCDFLVNIPMIENFDSLNASVAGGILMSEIFRQRLKK